MLPRFGRGQGVPAAKRKMGPANEAEKGGGKTTSGSAATPAKTHGEEQWAGVVSIADHTAGPLPSPQAANLDMHRTCESA